MRFIAILFCVATLFSCSKKPNTSSEVVKLDSLLTEVNKAENVFNSEIDHSEITWRLDSLKSIMSIVENFEGEIVKDDAKLVAMFYDTRGIVKKYKNRAPQIKREIKRTQEQLVNFKQALTSNATHDKSGNVIDKAYVAKQMRKETEAAEYLVKSIMELKERSVSFIKENEQRLKDVLPYVKGL